MAECDDEGGEHHLEDTKRVVVVMAVPEVAVGTCAWTVGQLTRTHAM